MLEIHILIYINTFVDDGFKYKNLFRHKNIKKFVKCNEYIRLMVSNVSYPVEEATKVVIIKVNTVNY